MTLSIKIMLFTDRSVELTLRTGTEQRTPVVTTHQTARPFPVRCVGRDPGALREIVTHGRSEWERDELAECAHVSVRMMDRLAWMDARLAERGAA